jgi:hypothetical protein
MELTALILDNRSKKAKRFSLPVTTEYIASEFGYDKEDILFTIQSIEELPKLKVEGATLSDINKLAKELEFVYEEKVLTYIELGNTELSDLLVFEFLDCALYPEIHNDLQLGMYLVKENGFNLALFLKYLDYEKYGHDVRLEEGGSFTDRGYFLPKADRL